MAASGGEHHQPGVGASVRLARIGLAALTAILTVNLYTGAPLLAIWIGSKVQGGTGLTMKAVGTVLGVLVVAIALIVFCLLRVEAAYKVLTGQPTKREPAPWLRSMRDERAELRERKPLDGFEKSLVSAVVVAIAASEIWFFFFAGSSIGTG